MSGVASITGMDALMLPPRFDRLNDLPGISARHGIHVSLTLRGCSYLDHTVPQSGSACEIK